MGIKNFRSYILKSSGYIINLQDYKDNDIPIRIGIDLSSWINIFTHKYGDMLSDERHISNYGRACLIQEQQQKENDEKNNNNNDNNTDELQKFITACCEGIIERLETLRKSTNAEILGVLDGATPPGKLETVKERRIQQQEEQRQRDMPVNIEDHSPALQRRFKANKRTGAGIHHMKVVDAVIEYLRNNQIPFLIAPYEADGQLAYLQMKHYIDLVITEDSDLIAYGLETPVLYNLSPSSVEHSSFTCGVLIRKQSLAAKKPYYTHNFDFIDMSSSMMACFFAVAGCDYCDSLPNIGPKKALDAVRDAFLLNDDNINKTNHDNDPPLKSLIKILRHKTNDKEFKKNTDLQKKYAIKLCSAIIMYRHCVVYDPIKRKCCHLLSITDNNVDPELMSYRPYSNLRHNKIDNITGPLLPQSLATYIAEGWISPKTLQLRSTFNNENIIIPEYVKTALQQYHSNNNDTIEHNNIDNENMDMQ